jgi:EmrB/QacA subfamily drug resistance transporter
VLLETSLNVTFPTLSQYFTTSLNNVQWLTTGYLLTVALTVIIAAYLQQRFGAKRLLIAGLAAFTVGDILCFSAPSLVLLMLGRVLQGISTGIVLPLLFALIMRWVPRAYQGRYIGSAGMTVALAPSLGPTFGGLITNFTSWRVIFISVLPLALIFGILSIGTVEKEPARTRKFPWIQFLLLAIFFVGLTLGLNGLATLGALTWLELGVSAAALGAGLYLMSHQKTQLIQLGIFRTRLFRLSLILYFLVQFIQMGMTFLLPNFAQEVLGQNSMIAGLLLLPGSLLSAVLQPVTGRFFDRHGMRGLLLSGGIGSLIAILGFFLLRNHLSITTIAILFAAYMFGFSCVFNNSLTVGLQNLKPSLIGDGNALFNTFQQYSGSLATGLVAAIVTGAPALAQIRQQAAAFQYGADWSFRLLLGMVVLLLFIEWLVARNLKTE